MIQQDFDPDIAAEIANGNLTPEAAMIAQLLRNQENEIKKKEAEGQKPVVPERQNKIHVVARQKPLHG